MTQAEFNNFSFILACATLVSTSLSIILMYRARKPLWLLILSLVSGAGAATICTSLALRIFTYRCSDAFFFRLDSSADRVICPNYQAAKILALMLDLPVVLLGAGGVYCLVNILRLKTPEQSQAHLKQYIFTGIGLSFPVCLFLTQFLL
jgi:hypothetical protein